MRVLTETVEIPPFIAYVARPGDLAPDGPAVLVGMELFGVGAHVRDVCERLAALGFLAVAPDLYHCGAELPADEAGRAAGFRLLGGLTRDGVLDDIGATLGWLSDRGHRVAGMVGLSVGGHVAYLAAARFPLPAVAILYGGWLTGTDSPLAGPGPALAVTGGITGEVLFLVGETDPIVPPADRRAIAEALTRAGVRHELVEYPGAGHGFLCDRRASYHPEAAGDAWSRLGRLLDGVRC